jgi:hypothetical protein
MSYFTHPIAVSAPFARSVAIAALMGATMLAGPLIAARADTATNAAIQLAQAAAPQNPAAAGATEAKFALCSTTRSISCSEIIALSYTTCSTDVPSE